MHINLSIAQKLLGFFLINVVILSVIIGNGYIFTNHSVIDFKNIEEKSLPVSVIHTENLYLLESIRNSFRDAAVINERDVLTNALSFKSQLQKNLSRLKKYHVDTDNQEKLFNRYFEFTYKFTDSIIKNKNNFKLEDAALLQGYSNEVLILFKEEKKIAKDDLRNSLKQLSNNTSVFFKNSFIVSSIGLIIMIVLGITMYELIKHRFSDILISLENLIKEKPDFTIRILSNHDDEIGQLIKLFNKLSDKLEYAHNKSSKEFLAEIEDTQKEVVFTMGSIAESRSNETGNHVKRVAEYSKVLALCYGIDEASAEMLKQASPMHDIGKVAIADSILNKPGRFTDEERKVMDTHVMLGYDMLKHSNRPLLKMASIVALEHHEKWDGTGYPYGKKAKDIHIYGRITALADVFDALGSDRVYKKAWDDERIFKYFKEERAKHFDPVLIDIFFEKLDEFLAIRDTFKD